MSKRLLFRIVAGALSVLGVVTIVFVISRLTGDPAELMSPPAAPPEQIERTRQQLGLDEPIAIQYVDFVGNAATGDLGDSYYWRQDALDLVLAHLWATLRLAISAVLFAALLGIPLGLIAAFRRNSVLDRGLVGGAMLGQAIPAFWLGPILILLVSVRLGWTPAAGMENWRSYILPTVTLGWFQLAVLFRMTRAAGLETLNEDYVRLARSKGASKTRLAFEHVLPNTALPVLTVAGLALANLIGGSVIVETIFGWPGIGNLMIQAVQERDFPVVQAIALIFSIGYVGLNTLVDALYYTLDPRLRAEGGH